jgi:type IV secretory pathway VirB2 component (pilin)
MVWRNKKDSPLLLPVVALAAFFWSAAKKAAADSTTLFNPLGSVDTVPEAIQQVTNYVLGIAGAIVVLFIVIAGISYIVSTNEEKKEKQKRGLYAAVIGLVIIILSWTIVSIVMSVLSA